MVEAVRRVISPPPSTEAQAAFRARHGESVQIGKIHFYSNDFPETPEVISMLQTMANDAAFQQQYPDHRVFVLPTGEILGALPADKLRLVASRRLLAEAKERRISLFNCAIILTRPQGTPRQVLDYG